MTSRVKAVGATAGAFACFWFYVLSATMDAESEGRALLLSVVAILALLVAGRVWQRANDIAAGVYTAKAAGTEGAVLGAMLSVAITVHVFNSLQTNAAETTSVFYFQVVPSAVLFGLALGIGNAVSLFFLARRLLAPKPPRNSA